MIRRALCAVVCGWWLAAPVAALDLQVKDLRVTTGSVSTTIEVRDLLPDRFKRTIDDGGALHLRLQTELWELRPVWDRLVYPAAVRVFRLGRALSGREISVTDPGGTVSTFAAIPNPMPMVVEIGQSDRISASERYYVHVVATIGTITDQDIGLVNDAVFGREGEVGGLGSLGRLMFRTVLQVSDYLQSVTTEARSRRIGGADILRK